MTHTLAQTYSSLKSYREFVVISLMALCLTMIAIYAFNVVTLISRTVAMQKVQSQVAALTLTTNDLDGKYLEAMSSITPDLVPTYGFSEGQVSEYISNSAALGRVAFGGHEL